MGDSVSAGGRSEAAVAAINRCGWVTSMECDRLLYGKKVSCKELSTIHIES